MKFTEVKMDLFLVPEEYNLAHCISTDCALGAGIAVQFQKRFTLREELLKYSPADRQYPTCIKVGRTYNLITKEKFWHKPTYQTLEASLLLMKEQMLNSGITKLAMPRIASNLDRLDWVKVRAMIHEIFKDTEIEILVCYQ